MRVTTFHEWARTTATKLGYDFIGWVTQKERTEKIKSILYEVIKSDVEFRLYDPKDPDIIAWWNEELSWIFGQGIFDFSDYQYVERIGRGTAIRLPASDREYVWLIFEKYLEWLDETGKEDYDNVAGLVDKAISKNGGSLPEEVRYDHIFVDEIQDFDKSWLGVLADVPRVSFQWPETSPKGFINGHLPGNP